MKRGMIIAGGVIYLIMAVIHLLFWKFLNWPESLMCLARDNRVLIQVLNIHVAYTTFFFAFVSICFNKEMVTTALGKTLALGIGFFTVLRAINQVIFWPIDLSAIIIILVLLVRSFLYIGPVLLPDRPKSS